MDWTALGIEPTTDKKAITNAYRTRLAVTNPEDKPEEFKALREAYESALKLAKEAANAPAAKNSDNAACANGAGNATADGTRSSAAPDAPADGSTPDAPADANTAQNALTPLMSWANRLLELYNDYPRRITLDEWRALLDDDVCIALDTRGQAEEALLRFLMSERFLTHEVWKLLDERFALLDRRAELCETYPRGFVDNVLVDSIMYQPLLNYALFTPGKDAEVCDEYIRQFIRVINTPIEEAEPLAAELLSFPEQNPYGTACYAYLRAMRGNEEALSELRELWAANTSEVYIAHHYVEALLALERPEEAEVVAKATREVDKANRHTVWLLASAYAAEKNFKDAIECINDLMRSSGGDQYDLFTLSDIRMEWNISLIDQYEATLVENPDDYDTVLNLAWCYLQNDILDRSRALADRLTTENTSPYDYYNFVSQLYLAEGAFDEGFECSRKLATIIANMEPDGTEKTEKRIARLPGVIARCGYCLFSLNRREDAINTYESALSISPNDPDTLSEYARILVSFGEREKAFEMIQRLIDVNPTAYHPYYMLSQLYFDSGNDRDAFATINRALELESGDLGAYVLKMRILLRNGVFDEVHNIINYIKESGVEDDMAVMWCEGMLLEFENQGSEDAAKERAANLRARALYQLIIERIEAGEEFAWPAQIYFRAAVTEFKICEDYNDLVKENQLALLTKGITYDEKDTDLLDYRAWLLAHLKRDDEAIAAYEALIALPHSGLEAETALTELYRKRLHLYADRALPLYRKLVESEPDNAYCLYYLGLCALRVGELDEAERALEREREVEPDCSDPYRLLYFVALARRDNEAALAHISKAIEVHTERTPYLKSLYILKIRVLRRLGRWDEATALIRERDEILGLELDYVHLFETMLQAGSYEEAGELLKEWAKARDDEGKPLNRSGLAYARFKLALCRDGAEAGRRQSTKGRSYLRGSDKSDFSTLASYLNGDFEALAKTLTNEIETVRSRGGRDYGDRAGGLAYQYWRLGDFERAEQWATTAVELTGETLSQFTTYGPIFRVKRALALGILGREEEARAELELAREAPLCEQCDYCMCKDADIFESYLEDIFGNSEHALEKTRACMREWPDETDFWCFEQYLLSKAPDSETD